MKKKMKNILVFTLILAIAAFAAGCSGQEQNTAPEGTGQEENDTENTLSKDEDISQGAKEHPEIKYRRMPTASSDLFEAGIVPILEREGYTFTPVEITDSVQREIALSEDEIDMHVDAHTAYINNFNKEQGTELTPVLPIPTAPAGIYSGTKDDLADVADGDKIAFPDDPSNEARSLTILSQIGLIKMKDGIEPTKYTLADIAENPHNLDLVEMSGGSIGAVRTDFAYIILRGSDAYNSGIDFDTALAAEKQEDILADNVMQLVVNGTHKDDAWVQDVIAAYKSDEFKEFMKTQSSFWILPDYLR